MSSFCCTTETLDLSNPVMQGAMYWFRPSEKLTHTSKVYDVIGQNHSTITASSVVWRRSSRSGSHGQLTFTNNDLITAGNVLSLPESFTISVWAYTTQSKPSGSATIVSRGAYGGNFETNYFIGQNNSDSWLFYYRDNDGNSFSVNGGSASLNQWTHIVGTYSDTSSSMQLYVNGSSVSSNTGVGTPGISISQSFNIGSFNSNVDNWAGGIDDVVIYDKELNSGEVQNLYRESKGGYSNVVKSCCPKTFLFGKSSVADTFVASGGAICVGSATVGVIARPTVSGSALCADSAVVAVQYNLISAGGVLAAGSGNLSNVYIFSVSGGVLAAGQFVDSEGGVKLNSSAIVTVKYSVVASSGATCNSSAVVRVLYNPKSYYNAFNFGFSDGFQSPYSELHQGLLASSSASLRLIYQSSPSGGAKCNGISVVSARYRIVPTFGAKLASSAIEQVRYRPTVSGGAVMASSAILGKIFDTIGMGGALASSSAVLLFRYNPIITGSILANGESDNTATHLELGAGGAVCAGVALHGYGYIHVPSGGAVVASTAVLRLNYQSILSGGILASGQAQRVLVVPIAANGVVAAGVGFVREIFATFVSGGVSASGSASMFRLYSPIVATGGGLVAGNGLMVKISEYITAPPAGVVFGGSVLTNIKAISILDGRALMSGIADVFYVSSPEKILMYHQFDIGETAYFLMLSRGLYLKKQIRQIYLLGQTVFYEMEGGEIIAEDLLLSLADCRARSKGKSASSRSKRRKTSMMNPLPAKFATSPGLIRRVL